MPPNALLGAFRALSAFCAFRFLASTPASGCTSCVIRVLYVLFSCRRAGFGAWAEDTLQEEEEEEEEEDDSSSSSSSSSTSSASASGASGSQRAPTPEKKAARSTVLEKEKEKHKEKEKDKEKEPQAEGEAIGQQKQELAAAAQDVVVVEGAKGKEGKAKEGKPKGKEKGKEKGTEKGKEKAGGVGNVGFKIEGEVGPHKSIPAKTTRFEHYKDSAQYANDMHVIFTSHALCFACFRPCF